MATETPRKPSHLRGTRKAAALLVALGPDLSAQVLKHMPEDEIERLTTAVFQTATLSADARDAVLSEMLVTAKARDYVLAGGIHYATEILEKAVGSKKANEIVERVTATTRAMPFGFVRDADPMILLNFLQREHPQTIALILSHLPTVRASQILQGLAPELQADVSTRIATMGRTAPEVLDEVEGVLRRKLASQLQPHQEFTKTGGLNSLVNMLKQVDCGTEKSILEWLEKSNPNLADEIKKHMFVFDNVTLLDDRSIQRVLRDVDMKDLGLSLKGASAEVRDRILRNMSERAAAMLHEDMEAQGPVRLRHVEEAQGRIVAVIRQLDEAEEIIISRGGDDEDLVL